MNKDMKIGPNGYKQTERDELTDRQLDSVNGGVNPRKFLEYLSYAIHQMNDSAKESLKNFRGQ